MANYGYAQNLMHVCPDSKSVESCNSSCKINSRYNYKFLVNSSQSSVLIKIYSGNELHSSKILSNCKIFDSNNWVCEEVRQVDARNFIYLTDKMVEKKYVNKVYFNGADGHSDGAGMNFCTK